jgi:hypothetical protein
MYNFLFDILLDQSRANIEDSQQKANINNVQYTVLQ